MRGQGLLCDAKVLLELLDGGLGSPEILQAIVRLLLLVCRPYSFAHLAAL